MESQPKETLEEKITYTDDGEVHTQKKTTVQEGEDGSKHISEIVTQRRKSNTVDINNLPNATEVHNLEITTKEGDNTYLDAIKFKGEVAVLKEENKLIEILKYKTLEKIFKFCNKNSFIYKKK